MARDDQADLTDSRDHGILLSPILRPGDRVRLVSPASFPTAEAVADATSVLEGWQLRVEVGEHALDQWGYMAGRDEDRLSDLNDAFRDPGVRAVFATRGGAGAYRIVDGIDFDAVRRDPKPVVGFSDITHLHMALWQHCRLATVHGCLVGQRAIASVHQLLMTTEPLTLHRDPSALSASIEIAGRVTGPLIGGNLSAVVGHIGAGLPSLNGAILFLEDKRTIGLGQVDRQLTHLIRSGSLEGIRGIALGLFTGFDDYIDRGWTVLDVMGDRLTNLGVPVLGGLDVGHGGVGDDGGPDQFALSLGPMATLDTAAGTLEVGSCVHH